MRRSHSHNDTNTTQIAGVAALAAGVGALTALLFTSRNGNQTRQALRDKVKQFKTKAKDTKDDIADAGNDAHDVVEKAKRTASTKIDDTLNDK